jgi:signal transduction histidine kinase
LLLRVSNTGPGPSIELKEQLFEPFFRADPARARTVGFGLGLPFARAVIRAHGGDVDLVVTTPDRTEFVVTLPLVEWSGEALELLELAGTERPSLPVVGT